MHSYREDRETTQASVMLQSQGARPALNRASLYITFYPNLFKNNSKIQFIN